MGARKFGGEDLCDPLGDGNRVWRKEGCSTELLVFCRARAETGGLDSEEGKDRRKSAVNNFASLFRGVCRLPGVAC